MFMYKKYNFNRNYFKELKTHEQAYILGFIYAFPTIIINLIVVLILLVYSILFTSYLWKVIFAKDRNTGIKRFLKKYLFVLLICLVLGLVSSFLEAYLVPSMIKLVIKLFI